MPRTAAFGESGEAGPGREGTVEGDRRRQPRLARSQQLPRHPTAEAEPDGRQLRARRPAAQLVEPGPQVGDHPLDRGVAERRGGIALRRQARRAALLGQQVDGQGGVPVGGEAGWDGADVRGQPTVLVDHHHRTMGRVGLRDDTDQLAVGTAEADLLPVGRPRRSLGRGFRRARRLGSAAAVDGVAPRSSRAHWSRSRRRRRRRRPPSAVAAAAVTPSRPRRRSASRRDSSPASQSRATSSTM